MDSNYLEERAIKQEIDDSDQQFSERDGLGDPYDNSDLLMEMPRCSQDGRKGDINPNSKKSQSRAGGRQRKNSFEKMLEESPEGRAVRLAKMSAYARRRLASETPEQRSFRLKRMSEYTAKRLSLESPEERAMRLSRMSAYAAQRLANETPEQRSKRLLRMSAYAAKRHALRKRES